MSASVATPTTPSSSSSSSAVAASSTTPVLTGSASTPGGMHRESNAATAATPGPTTVPSSSFNFGPIATPTSTAVTTPPVVGATTTPNQSQAQTTPLLQHMPEEKVYKKEKQIWLEFDATTKDLKSQLNDGVKCLEQRLDTQIAILFELQDFFKKRAEVEMQYSRDLDKLVKQVYTRHKSERTKRENWPLHSAYKLWESLLNDTKQHSKYHQIASDVCSKYVADRFDDIVDDIKRMFTKCKAVAQSAHEEIFKVVGELNGAMKTYHEYQSESKQAEAKLRYVQSQKPKYEKQKSKKKLKQYEKQVEKRLQKYTETKVKAFKARNEYILSIDSANACINKFCSEDIGDIVDCMDYGFHASVAKCIYMYLSAQENIKRSRQQTVDNISRSIGDLDSNADKKSYLDFYSFIFSINRKFAFEPHKGDEVSQVNAQSLIRYEMEKRFEQLDMRLKTLKTENDEIFKTIEATEHSLLNYFDVKNCDMTDLFRDLNIPVNGANTPAGAASKVKRIEIEDYYVEKVRQYSISSNLIARLEARHRMMQKALGGCVNSSELDKTSSFDKSSPTITSASMHSNLLNMGSSFGGVGSGGSGGSERKKKIGKSPLIGQPRLFGGKLVEYLAATKQDLPQIMTSCVKAINRLGLHNQGIFRIPGSQLEINQFKEAFEKGDDPLVTVNPREMNSVAGVLKLYLRELKEPLFPRELYDQFIGALRVSLPAPPPPPQSASSDALLNGGPTNDLSSNSSTASPGENIEAAKIDSIRRTMALVPKPIYIVIRYLFAFLNHLSEYKDENMMDAYNIAICLAPTLIPVPEDKKDQVNNQTDTIELIKLIIQHNDEIFNIECDGPVYEKFDSEMDNDEENLDESEDDEEDESEKQYLRNISDDELYVAEAIALYDYKGRTDKELSFKKGTQLAIRGQLSTDWWQGSLIASNNGANTPLKVGYIPDKYIAFRSSSKKRHLNTSSSTAQTTVQSTTTSSPLQLLTNMSSSAAVINTTKSTPPANNMKQSLRSSHHHTIHHHPHHHPYPLPHHNHGSATRASLDILELSSVNHPPPTHQYRHQRGASTDPLLCSQPHVKESDILNDECDNTASNPSNSMNEIIAAAALAAAAAVDQTAANLNEELHLQRFQPNSSSMRSASVSLQHKASSNNYSAAANRMHSQSIKKRNSSSPSSSNSISFDTHFVNSVNQVANNTSNNTNTLTTRQYNSNNGNNYLNMSSSTTGTLSNRGVASRSSYTKSSSSNNTANRGVVTSPANRSGSGLDMELAYLLASTTSAAAAAVAAASQSINSNVPKQQMKVNHIEDALASVLDDMKKLDCSGNLSNEMADDISRKGTVSHQPPPLFSTRSTSSSSSASNTPSATTPHQRTRETRDSNANGSFTTTTPPPPPPVHSYSAFKFSSDSSSSSQDNPKYEEKPLSNDSKTAAPNSTESETKRPDLVIDLPIVMAANNNNTNSSSPSSSSTSGSSQAATVLPIKKPPMVSHRQSTPPSSQTVTYTTTVTVNTNPMIATASDGVGVSAAARNDDVVKSISMMENSATSSSSSQVRRLSVDGVLSSSSASSSLSSSPAANTANNKTQLVDVSDATLSSSIHQQDRIENGEMVMMSTKPLKSCSTSSTDSSVCSSSVSSSNVVNPNPKQQPTTTTSLTTSKEEDEIESISPPRIAVAQFVRSPQTTVASITQPTDSSSSTSSTTVAAKKKPPPLMKKPEKSEEILRKLGRSPPSIDTNNANTTAQTTLSSPPIASPPSSASSNSPAANLSLRLSNSKATDV